MERATRVEGLASIRIFIKNQNRHIPIAIIKKTSKDENQSDAQLRKTFSTGKAVTIKVDEKRLNK